MWQAQLKDLVKITKINSNADTGTPTRGQINVDILIWDLKDTISTLFENPSRENISKTKIRDPNLFLPMGIWPSARSTLSFVTNYLSASITICVRLQPDHHGKLGAGSLHKALGDISDKVGSAGLEVGHGDLKVFSKLKDSVISAPALQYQTTSHAQGCSPGRCLEEGELGREVGSSAFQNWGRQDPMSPNLITNQITIWFQIFKQGSEVTVETLLHFKGFSHFCCYHTRYSVKPRRIACYGKRSWNSHLWSGIWVKITTN